MRPNRERGDHGAENASSCSGSNGDRADLVAKLNDARDYAAQCQTERDALRRRRALKPLDAEHVLQVVGRLALEEIETYPIHTDHRKPLAWDIAVRVSAQLTGAAVPQSQTIAIGPDDTAIIVEALEYMAARKPCAPIDRIARIRAALTGRQPS